MIHLWDRRELATFFELDRCRQAQAALDGSQIEYQVKTRDRTSPSPFSTGTRERSGALFQEAGASWQYTIYVKRGDLERARACAGLGPVR